MSASAGSSSSATALPEWAEDVLRRFGPQPAFKSAEPDPTALARYAFITERFRRRWSPELTTEVWPLFRRGGIEHLVQAQHLLGRMIDMARYGSRSELAAKRDALEDIGRREDELRQLAATLRNKISYHADLVHEHGVDGGLDDDLLNALEQAAAAVDLQNWREPRLWSSDYTEAISSRKSSRDALNMMLIALLGIERLLLPVKLTDAARAAVFNVAHDTNDAEHCAAETVKKARADLRNR